MSNKVSNNPQMYESLWSGSNRIFSSPVLYYHELNMKRYTDYVRANIMTTKVVEVIQRILNCSEQEARNTLPLISNITGPIVIDANGKYHELLSEDDELAHNDELLGKIKDLFKKPPEWLMQNRPQDPEKTVDEEIADDMNKILPGVRPQQGPKKTPDQENDDDMNEILQARDQGEREVPEVPEKVAEHKATGHQEDKHDAAAKEEKPQEPIKPAGSKKTKPPKSAQSGAKKVHRERKPELVAGVERAPKRHHRRHNKSSANSYYSAHE